MNRVWLVVAALTGLMFCTKGTAIGTLVETGVAVGGAKHTIDELLGVCKSRIKAIG